MASLKDVALIAGVSPSTVSYYLNGKKKLKEETVEKINRAVEQTGYKPNMIARSLKMKVSKSVGVVVADLSNIFYIDVLAGIENILTAAEYSSIVSNSRNSAEVESGNIRELCNRNIDGIILIGTGESKLCNIKDIPVPVVCVDRVDDESKYKVSMNNRKGTYLGAKYLLQKNKKNIIFIGFDSKISSIERRMGCIDAYKEQGLDHENLLKYIECGISPEEGYDVIMKLFSDGKLDKCDAIFAGADFIAVGVLQALRNLEYRIPEDISVLGFDDLPLSQYLMPPLSTVGQPKFEMGQCAAKMLLDLLMKKDTKKDVFLEPKLMIRGSA